MCGRTVFSFEDHLLTELAVTSHSDGVFPAAARVGQPAVFVANTRAGERRADVATWGVPIGDRLIGNARVESLDKERWQHAFETSRCVVPVRWFYEGQHKFRWMGHDTTLLGGLLFPATQPGFRRRLVVLTEAARAPVSAVHGRQPVLIHPRQLDAWLARAPYSTPTFRLTSIEEVAA